MDTLTRDQHGMTCPRGLATHLHADQRLLHGKMTKGGITLDVCLPEDIAVEIRRESGTDHLTEAWAPREPDDLD